MNMSKRIKNPVLYPHGGSYYPCHLLGADPFVEVKTEQGNVIKTHLVGKYNFDNIATALCIGKYFNIPEDQANNAISSYTPDNNRSQILKKGSNTIILDAYNANPSSMEKALENLAQMNTKSKIAIIGDMFELGEDTKSEHEMIGKMLKKLHIQDAIFCGESMKYAYDTFGKGNYMKTRDLLTSYLIETKFSDSTILIKASRGMSLEQIVDYLDSN